MIKNINIIRVSSALFMMLLFTGAAGRCDEEVRQRMIEQEKIADLAATERAALDGQKRLSIDYGGWFNFRYDDYKDDDNDAGLRDDFDYDVSCDLRLWFLAKLNPPAGADYKNVHSFYCRFKDLYINSRPRDVGGGSDNDGPHVDYAYVTMDLRPVWGEAGRRYFSIGRGVAYSNVNDGAEIYLAMERWNFRGFASHTLPHEENVDMSIPGYGKTSDRYYYGAQVDCRLLAGHGIYGYFLAERDFSDADPQDALHGFEYDAEYFGLGANGRVVENLKYWAEFIKETGESRIYDTNEKSDVDAWSAMAGISYDAECYSHPSVLFEYAFGSGDPDRASVTDTQGGNTSGKDKNFLYFGYFPTGYALAPRLSNIHIYKAGAYLKPLEGVSFFKRCTVGVNYYRYYKDKSEGGIYDPEANRSSANIGDEIDLYVIWRMLSDLSVVVQYGHFRPSGAYPDATHDSEDYLGISSAVTF